MRSLDDKAWLRLLLKSVSKRQIDKVDFPGFPTKEVQTQFVGSSNQKTLKEAFQFYVLMKEYCRQSGNPIGPKSRFLDFGCGWGRFLRFFWKDVDEENLYGCDINEMIVNICHSLNLPGEITLIEAKGCLPYPDNHFDAMIAYSVFTHLPEKMHLHWMQELARVARPGCVFGLTLEPRRFIDFIAGIPPYTQRRWQKFLLAHKPRLKDFAKAYDSGDFVFMPTNEGFEDIYGDAMVPLSFIEKHWAPYFKVRAYVDEPRNSQAVLVVQRI
jgi:SAM-dependent methyltransferase